MPHRARVACAGASFALGLVVTLAIARADDDPNRAQFLTSCGTCHSTEPGAPPRQGPNLFGVYGRKAGTLEGSNILTPSNPPIGPGTKSTSIDGSKTPRQCGRASSCPIA